MGVINNEKQNGSKSIAVGTWTKILSLTLSPGTYIIFGQLNIIGKQATGKYVAIVDPNMASYNAVNFILQQVYTQVMTILSLSSAQTISLAAYATGESATVSNGDFVAVRLK